MKNLALLFFAFFSSIYANAQTELIAGSCFRPGGKFSKPIVFGINLGVNYNRWALVYSYSREKLSNEIFNFSSYDWNEITTNENTIGLYYCVSKSEKIKFSPGILNNWVDEIGKYTDQFGENYEYSYKYIDLGTSIKVDYYLSPKINIHLIGNYLFLRKILNYESNTNWSMALGLGYRLGDRYNYKKEESIENKIKVY